MIEIDFTWFNQFYGMDPWTVGFIFLFKYYLWIPLLIFILHDVVYPLWMLRIWAKFAKKQRFIYLAIDVPKRNEQSIKGMEQVFVQLLGAHGSINMWEKYVEGVFQLSFSFEIVSIDGYVQFLIRSPHQYRDLVESSIYAQYPDAEITEVEDYTKTVPHTYPNETHEMLGVEYILDNADYYPIRTYPLFEHAFAKTYVDPLAALLEAMSKITKGEQIWIQMIAKPLAPNWADKEGQKFVKNLIGATVEAKKSSIEKVADGVGKWVGNTLEQLLGEGFAPGEEQKTKDLPSRMQFLSPGEKEKVEFVEQKMSKQGYSMKMRLIYVAEKAKFKKTRGLHPIVGALKQFGLNGSNGFKPAMSQTATFSPKYLFVNYRCTYRKNLIMAAYCSRDRDPGMKAWILNVEELASVWHFPSMYVKAPMIKKTEITKAEPPSFLPFEISEEEKGLVEQKAEAVEATSFTPAFDYDNDDFEKRFAKDKEMFEETRQQRAEVLAKVEKEEAEKLKKLKEEEKIANQKIKKTEKVVNNIKSNFKKEVVNRDEPVKPPANLPFVD